MKGFYCGCDRRIFFEDLICTHCNRQLGFDPGEMRLLMLTPAAGRDYTTSWGSLYRYCRNHDDYGVCNWLIPSAANDAYCLSCRRNSVVPNLAIDRNVVLWGRLEQAKRRLLYTLLSLGLPIDGIGGGPPMTFRFLEDQRANPYIEEEFIATGHQAGTITINLLEADDSQRHSIQESMSERYRTLLGHFRHESGHYYFEVAVDADRDAFRELFGDERSDYAAALKTYYESSNPPPEWASSHISQYASAHPLEDWAETWAHYLHIVDTLETAEAAGIVRGAGAICSDSWLNAWLETSVTMNELNRSMGINDSYPFSLSSVALDKLKFIHRRVERLAHAPAIAADR